MGVPNYWGQYTHGSIGYGRCNERYYTNDKFVIDYPLNDGDVVFSPFKRGTVVFAGRNYTHRHYGIFVVVRDDNGKYVSMSAHLSSLKRGIERGAKVDLNSIIGYAGNTGDPSITVGEVHLHQAYYRKPSYNSGGSPYGGAAGLQAIYHRYWANADHPIGVYQFAWPQSDTRSTRTKGELIRN